MPALYYTDGELLRAPTGIEWTSIPKKGSTAEQQQAERARLIRSGSNFVETQAGQKLVATQDAETTALGGRYAQLRPEGLFVKTPNSPIVSVDQVEHSADGISWRVLTGTAIIKTRASFVFVGSGCGRRGWIRYLYTNGFPDAQIVDPVGEGDTTLTLTNTLGMVPLSNLTIYDDDSCEDVRVASATGSTVLLTGGLEFAHGAKTVISGIPQEVRDACRIAIVHYVRARGRDAIAIQATGGARIVRAGSATEDLNEAIERLASYRRII